MVQWMIKRGELKMLKTGNQNIKTKTLFSKGDCEFDRARLEIGIKTMFSGKKRVCVWKTNPDGTSWRKEICYYNLYTGSVLLSDGIENYPEIDFEKEMKMFAEDPYGYESIYDEILVYDTDRLIGMV
jgi:hypothetical protein